MDRKHLIRKLRSSDSEFFVNIPKKFLDKENIRLGFIKFKKDKKGRIIIL